MLVHLGVLLFYLLTLNFVISSLIVGTYNSACKTLKYIYHGAFTIARRTLRTKMRNCENKEWQVHGGKYEHIFQQLITAIALLTYDCLVYMKRCFVLPVLKTKALAI